MFGFLAGGKVDIFPEKTNFKYGETINGKAVLDLKNAKKARGLYVVLIAERTSTSMGSKGTKTSKQRLVDLIIPIDGEKEYPAGKQEYNFSIQIPQENKVQIEGNVGAAINMLQSIGEMFSPIKWYLEVKLDIAGGVDIRKQIQISVIRANNTGPL